MNYDAFVPKPKCPPIDCKKKGDCCITTRKVLIPAIFSDEEGEYKTTNGLFCDAIVEYEANGHVYIYSSDGIPTQIKSDSTDGVKLYDTTGDNIDGAMTQKATTEALDTKQNTLIAGDGVVIENDVISAASATVDSALSHISENPVQNKVITEALDGKANSSEIAHLATKAELQTKADKTELDNYTTTTDLDAQLALKADKTQLGNYATIADMNAGLDAKQDILTAGTGIDITNNVISATGGGSTPGLQEVLEAGHIANKFFRITLDNDTNTFSQVGGNQVTTQRTADGVTRSSTITTEGLSLSKVGRGVPTEYFEVSLIGRGGVEDPLVRISDGVKTAFNAALGNVSYTAGIGIDITNGVISSTVDTSTFATKTELTSGLATKADTTALEDYYTKTQADALLADKADTADLPDMTDYYNKTQTDALLADKADTSALADYATTQALTTGLASKADQATTYTKTEVDTLVGGITLDDVVQNGNTTSTNINVENTYYGTLKQTTTISPTQILSIGRPEAGYSGDVDSFNLSGVQLQLSRYNTGGGGSSGGTYGTNNILLSDSATNRNFEVELENYGRAEMTEEFTGPNGEIEQKFSQINPNGITIGKIDEGGETRTNFLNIDGFNKTVEVDSELKAAFKAALDIGSGGGNANFTLDTTNNFATIQSQTQGISFQLDDADGVTVTASDPGTYINTKILATQDYVDSHSGGAFVLDTANPCSYNELQSAINAPKVILVKHEGVVYPFVEKWESDEGAKRYVNIASLQRQAVDKGAMYFFFEATIGDFDSPMTYSSNFTQPTGKPYTDNIAGNLTDLTTTAKTNVVSAINELKSSVDALGEPFRVKQWGANNLNVTIVPCTSDAANTDLAKMVFTITGQEATDYQIVGMIAYEVFDAASGGNRINCWPVCQFTGNGQTELSIRWMCGGTTNKVAKRINAWVLLKHR